MFSPLSKAKVQDNRMLVISKNEVNGGYTIAQQLSVENGKSKVTVFLKGALHIDALDGLYNFRDALNEAIHKEEKT